MRTSKKQRPIALEDIAVGTLRGDVRDFLMGWFRNTPKPWTKMSEAEQANFAQAADKQAENLVRTITNLVGSQGFRSFEVSVGDFQKKGNRLEAKIAAPYSRDNLIEMAEAGEAGPIVLSLVSLDVFQGERAPAKVMPDQPDLMDDDDRDASLNAAGGQQDEADLQAGETVDPETGEVIEVQPEDGQRQGEQRFLTYGGEESEDPSDDFAAAQQDMALSPEQQTNVERLGGIQQLVTSDGERIDEAEDGNSETSGKAKRRSRRTVEQRVADNARAVEAGRAP